MEVHLALANKDVYGELLSTALAFPELVSLLLDQPKLHLGYSNPIGSLSGHQSASHALEGLYEAQTVLAAAAALVAFLASFLAKVPHKEHQNALEMEA